MDETRSARGLAAFVFVALLLCCRPGGAEVVTDGTVGPARNLTGPNFLIGADLGTSRGTNLFHSFRTFNLQSNQSATFTGPDRVTNVISRVTGGQVSNIDGLLRSQVGQADFYFINPAGVVFGPSAQVDVPAAFHLATADELRLEDGAIFSATDPAASTLSAARPESFGFLSPQPASLVVNGSRLEFTPGGRASIVAGDIGIRDGATLGSEGGEIHFTAVGSSETAVDLASATAGSPARGSIAVSGSSTLDVSGASGTESVTLSGGQIEIADSEIAADHSGSTDAAGTILLAADDVRIVNSDIHARVFGSGRGNDIAVMADNFEVIAATARDGRSRLTTRVMPGASGGAGDVRVEAGRVALTQGGTLSSIVEEGAAGRGGTVKIRASDSVRIEGANDAGGFSGIVTTSFSASNAPGGTIVIDSPTAAVGISDGGFLQAGTVGVGRSGDIRIAASELHVSGGAGGAVIDAHTTGGGNGGSIQIGASGAVTVIDSGLWVDTTGSGAAGSIAVAGKLIELREGELSANTYNTGKAGNIRLEARDAVILSDSSEIQAFSGSLDTASRLGDAGHIRIDTGSLSMQDSSIDVFSSSLANAGSIEVTAKQIRVDSASGHITAFDASNFAGRSIAAGSGFDVTKEGRSGTVILSASDIFFDQDSDISVLTNAGDGGSVVIRGDELRLLNGSGVLAITAGPGRGGEVHIDMTGTVSIEGASPYDGTAARINTGTVELQDIGYPENPGPAGAIDVAAETLLIGQNGSILSDSFSSSPAGPITLDVATLELKAGGEISSSAGAEGPGADIDISARQRVLVSGLDPLFSDPSEILADASFSEPDGRGGSIRIEAPLVVLEEGGVISSEADLGAGGAIKLSVDRLIVRNGGEISTSAFGARPAGTIQVIADSISISGKGRESLPALRQDTGLFSETSLGTGKAGTIDLNADRMEVLAGGQVSTSTSSAGQAGTILLSARELVIESGVSDRQISSITSTATTLATGKVGTTRINADSVMISGGEITIAAEQNVPENNLGSGLAGVIQVVAGQAQLDQGARITAQSAGNVPASAIQIQAGQLIMEGESEIITSSINADGGPITIGGGALVLRDSRITTSVEGQRGDGGDIILNPRQLVLDTGFVQANTEAQAVQGELPEGGAIHIGAQAVVRSGGSLEKGLDEPLPFQPGSGRNIIQAAAPAGNPGDINLVAPNLDISGALANLSTPIIDPARLVSDPCAAVAGEAASSLVQLGRGGLPPGPRDPAAVSYGGSRLDRLLSAPTPPARQAVGRDRDPYRREPEAPGDGATSYPGETPR